MLWAPTERERERVRGRETVHCYLNYGENVTLIIGIYGVFAALDIIDAEAAHNDNDNDEGDGEIREL